MEGKLNRPGRVLRYVNSKTYSPRNQRRVYIQESSRVDDYKNFYLDTPEGQSRNAFEQMNLQVKTFGELILSTSGLLLLERRLMASALKPRVRRPIVSSGPTEVHYPSRDDDDSGKGKVKRGGMRLSED